MDINDTTETVTVVTPALHPSPTSAAMETPSKNHIDSKTPNASSHS